MSVPNPLLADDAPIEVIDARELLSGSAPRRRGTAHLLRLDSGRVLLLYTIRRPQPTGLTGALMITRSDDEGATWEEPYPLLAMPGANAYAMSLSRIRDDRLRISLGRVTVDRSLGGDEPFSDWWSGEVELRDGGESWSAPGPELKLFPYWTEMYGPSNPHRVTDGRLLWIAIGTVGRDEGWRVGVTVTDAEGSAYGPVTVVAAAPDRNFADSDMARLRDGRFVAVMREMATRHAYMAFSDDEGATWSEPELAGFRGSNIRLQPLRDGSVLCAYREEDPERYGVSVSVSDDGRSWRWVGQLYRAGPDVRHEPTLYCGYPAFARLGNGDLLCVLHTYVDDAGRAAMHQLRIRDRT